jgi:hypothetical protein
MFDPGQDVIVTFDGEDCQGEVIESKHGWILAKVLIDPASDHGGISPTLSPVSQVMVRESDVRIVE